MSGLPYKMLPNKLLTLFLLGISCFLNGLRADETELHDFLFNTHTYNKHIRPKSDHRQAVDVTVDFELINIIGLDEIDEVLTVTGMFIVEWVDDHLAWIPGQYGNIESMVIQPGEIWIPDIGIENSADKFYQSTFAKDFRPRIYNNGRIQWSFGGQISTTCGLDMTYFPFDKQTCMIQMANWAYHNGEVAFKHKYHHIHLDAFQGHGIWNLTGTEVESKNIYFEATGPYPYPEVDFIILLERKSQFYMLNLILPCVLVIGVALGNFWLPIESGEKASLAVTLLLAFSVLQVVLTEQTPKDSDHNPVLGQMVIWIMTLSAISVLMSIIVLYLYHKEGGARVPYTVRRIFFKGLAAAVCMRSSMPDVPERGEVSPEEADGASSTSSGSLKAPIVVTASGNEMESIVSNLDYISKTIRDKEDKEVLMEEWRALARVLDRILFWISFIVVLIVLIVFMTKDDKHH